MIHNDRLNRLRRTSRAGHRRVRWDIRSRAPCRSTCETTICGSIRLSIVQTESRVTQIRTSEPATRICRAEVFNVLNHANFSHPEPIVFSAMTSRARPGSFEKRRTASARSSSRCGWSSNPQLCSLLTRARPLGRPRLTPGWNSNPGIADVDSPTLNAGLFDVGMC